MAFWDRFLKKKSKQKGPKKVSLEALSFETPQQKSRMEAYLDAGGHLALEMTREEIITAGGFEEIQPEDPNAKIFVIKEKSPIFYREQ